MKDKKRETGCGRVPFICFSHVEQEASPASAASSTPEEKTGQTELSVLQESRTSEKFESLFNEVQEVSDAVDALKQTNSAQEKFIKELEEKLNVLEVHHRRWSLHLKRKVTGGYRFSAAVCGRQSRTAEGRWLKSESCHYKVFVGTRIAEIQDLTKHWRHLEVCGQSERCLDQRQETL